MLPYTTRLFSRLCLYRLLFIHYYIDSILYQLFDRYAPPERASERAGKSKPFKRQRFNVIDNAYSPPSLLLLTLFECFYVIAACRDWVRHTSISHIIRCRRALQLTRTIQPLLPLLMIECVLESCHWYENYDDYINDVSDEAICQKFISCIVSQLFDAVLLLLGQRFSLRTCYAKSKCGGLCMCVFVSLKMITCKYPSKLHWLAFSLPLYININWCLCA